MNLRTLLILLLFYCLPALATSKTGTDPEHTYKISRTTEPIIIDGVLSESTWNTVAVTEGFWMTYPVDDRAVEEGMQTEVRITYEFGRFDDDFAENEHSTLFVQVKRRF